MSRGSEQVTEVKIYNQTYSVKSGGNSEYVRSLAQYLDEKMVEVSQQTRTVDTLKVAILAALNIADDYFTTRRRMQALQEELSERAGRMISKLESLPGPDRP